MTAPWGKPYGSSPFILADGRRVTMYRRGVTVRYYDETGVQVGPEHRNVVPALIWAWAQDDWYDPSTPPSLMAGVKAEIRAGGRR
jgi:hypothetical protein